MGLSHWENLVKIGDTKLSKWSNVNLLKWGNACLPKWSIFKYVFAPYFAERGRWLPKLPTWSETYQLRLLKRSPHSYLCATSLLKKYNLFKIPSFYSSLLINLLPQQLPQNLIAQQTMPHRKFNLNFKSHPTKYGGRFLISLVSECGARYSLLLSRGEVVRRRSIFSLTSDD